MNGFQIISRRMGRDLENGGNFCRILAERHPAQALNLSRGEMRSVFAEHLGHHPTMKPVGDLYQFRFRARQKFRPSLLGLRGANDKEAPVTVSTCDGDRISVWPNPVRKRV
jgi:hypothetical protein